MSKRDRWPCALTIAGSDSGGGAGIQADLKTFAALKVHGTSVITCVTAQNPKSVIGVEPITPQMVEKQMETVFAEFPVKAVKLGMLYSQKIMEAVARGLEQRKPGTVVIADPVMIATSGKPLLLPAAVRTLEKAILPRCDLMTPNVPEAEALAGIKIRTPEDLRKAARVLHGEFGCAVLAKGGHLKNCQNAIDIYYTENHELLLETHFVKGVSTHGTGCTYSAAICGYCAHGFGLKTAVIRAKKIITGAIASSVRVGNHDVLNSRVMK